MRLSLDYGRMGLMVDLTGRDVRHVLGLTPAPPLASPSDSVRDALLTAELPRLAVGKRSACIIICDFTRPVPNQLILGEILPLLGLAPESITILIATGTHRASTPAELLDLLGKEILHSGVRVIDHDCDDPATNRFIGTSPGNLPIYLDTHWLDAELKITVGLIEPHFMAGYSGGRKLVMPGVAGRETIQAWHSPQFLEHDNARNGVLDNNPVHEENTAIAAFAPADLICDVTLDEQRRVTGVFCGHWITDWRRGTEFIAQQARPLIPEAVDVCLTSGGGYPLDATFYQVVKGIVGAYPIVKPGGTVIIAAQMQEGIGSAHFRETLEAHSDLDTLVAQMSAPGWNPLPDQWQVEMLARACRNHKIIVVTEPERAKELRGCHVDAVGSMDEALARISPDATIAIIPKGPYVIPAIQTEV
ncbi:nickel-dependent lactate racemase [Armatimonas sp.]|uniref:nickel-dependent lactate racemase n=1 Tax=Armatimonas sp. TaxID=1872638 RepID=UPI00286CC821|nr:nickel-dependent lactate racemase [Armatimonas sp.]